MKQTPLLAQFQRRAEDAEAEARRLQVRLLDAEARAVRVERACRDAWQFTRRLMHRPIEGTSS